MRRVACYSATSPVAPSESASDVLSSLVRVITDWLGAKGLAALPEGSVEFKLRDGRVATASAASAVVGDDAAWEFSLQEPTESGQFLTRICIGVRTYRLYLFLELRAGGDGCLVVPVAMDARCPQVLRDLLDRRVWSVGSTPAPTTPIRWHGAGAARKFMAVVGHRDRNLPVVAVSQQFGRLLTPTLAEDLARDLSGVALVAHLDEAASWEITNRAGKEWSCFNGAVRVYWPLRGTSGSAFDHPVWLRERLIERAVNEPAAASQIRNQLRRRLLELSTYTFDEPAELQQVREDAARARFDTLVAEAAEKGDQAELAEHYFNESVRLEKKTVEQRDELERLRDQVASLSQAMRHLPATAEDEIAPEPDTPVNTVAEAVSRATAAFREDLVFGEDVADGVRSVVANAGPPDKVYEHLKTLAEMTQRRRTVGIGKDMIVWLKEQGIKASNESETTLRSQAEMQRRTWGDGAGQRRQFEKHLKPKESTNPGQCVRIYFEYDDAIKKTVVGWVGRHPGT